MGKLMDEDFEKIIKMEALEIEKYLPTNKYTFSVQVDRLLTTLQKIKPRPGNFLYWDILGRILWNATATAKSMENLLKFDDHYGFHSLARKLLECKLLIIYLSRTENKSKVIARIMAYEYFDKKQNLTKEKLLEYVSVIVNGFKEDVEIIEYFKQDLDRGPKHWHWTEKSFEKLLISTLTSTGNKKIDSFMLATESKILNLFHKGMHVDLELEKDYLRDKPDGDIEYISPFEKSNEKLLGVIGLARLIIMDIIDLIELELSNKKKE